MRNEGEYEKKQKKTKNYFSFDSSTYRKDMILMKKINKQ